MYNEDEKEKNVVDYEPEKHKGRLDENRKITESYQYKPNNKENKQDKNNDND